jgi:hypothetical protein
LSCGKCNGDEKRELHWLKFLKSKITNKRFFQARKKRIAKWVALNKPVAMPNWKTKILKEEIKRVEKAFDKAASRLRGHRDAAKRVA